MSECTSTKSRIITGTLVGIGAYFALKEVVRKSRKIDLAGRTVLITGGSRGLGLALAREFARHRARLALCARSFEELAAAQDDIRRFRTDVRTFACDLRDPTQIARLIDAVESTWGTIDVLVNNAGVITVGPAQTMTLDDYREALDVNFWSAVHTTRALAPRMAARGGGRIVNIASIGGKVPVPHLAPYSASKFALVGFSGALRTELIKDGVLVTTVNPGLMRTGSPRNAAFKGKHAAEYAWFSISDVLPGLSMSADSAARRIVNAAVHGDAEITLGLPARVAATLYGVAPALTLELAALVNRLLPGAGGTDPGTRRGHQSESQVTRLFLQNRARRAEREYNQLKT
jgi:short-subunit dehydrogenase